MLKACLQNSAYKYVFYAFPQFQLCSHCSVSDIIDESTCLSAPGDDDILELDLVEHIEREAEVVLEALHGDAGVVAEAAHAAAVGRHADSAAQVRDPILGDNSKGVNKISRNTIIIIISAVK